MTVETTNPVVWEITDCERCSQLVMDWEGSRENYDVGTCWNPSVEEKHGIQDGVSPKCPFPNPFPPWIWDHLVDFGAISWPINCGADNFKQRKAVRQSGQVYVMTILKKCLVPNMSCFTWGLYPQVPVSPSSLKMPIQTPTKTDFCLISSERKGWKPQKWGQTGTMPRHSNCSLGRFQQNSMTGAFVALWQSFREAMSWWHDLEWLGFGGM